MQTKSELYSIRRVLVTPDYGGATLWDLDNRGYYLFRCRQRTPRLVLPTLARPKENRTGKVMVVRASRGHRDRPGAEIV